MQTEKRRYDIDWLRVIAIGLLLIFHIGLVFQPWGKSGGFIQSEETSDDILILISMLSVWRIPLLFFVSGMGMCFALRRRNWKQLLLERTKRILLPLIFGTFAVVPIHVIIFQKYYEQEIVYFPNFGHLWFLANIIIYVIQMIGFAFLNSNYDYKFFNILRKWLKQPYSLYLFIIPFIIEAELTNPEYFSIYIGNSHGFLIGMLAFFCGFIFIALGDVFWNAVEKVKFSSLLIALVLFLIRLLFFDSQPPHFLSSIESMNWIFALFGFGHKYLNNPSQILTYLSQAAYPIYIIHMIFLYWASYIILPLDLPLELNFLLIVLITFIGCFITYEFLIKRICFFRPLFGLKGKH